MPDRLGAGEVWVFFGLVLAVNAGFVALVHAGLLPSGLYNLGRFLLLGAVLALVVWAGRGRAGLVALVRPLGRWRVGPGWFVLAACWALAIALSVLLGRGLLLGLWPQDWLPGLGVLMRPGVALTVLVAALVGEIVWVGYAIGRLAPRFGVLGASMITGLVWTGWWLPMVWFGVGVIPDLPLGLLTLNMLGVAAMCGFLYAHTRSGIVVLVLQLMLNSVLVVLPVAPSSGGVAAYGAFALAYLGAVLALFALRPPPRAAFG